VRFLLSRSPALKENIDTEGGPLSAGERLSNQKKIRLSKAYDARMPSLNDGNQHLGPVAPRLAAPLRRRRQKDAWIQRLARGVQSSSKT